MLEEDLERVSFLLVIPIVAGVISMIRHRSVSLAFFIAFLFATCGLGFYYNNIFRMGNIFPSDIWLLLFLVVYMVESHLYMHYKKRDLAFLVLIVIFESVIGLFSGFGFSDILTDFKYILYFFIPTMYLKDIFEDRTKMVMLFQNYVALICLTLALNWLDFFNNGLTNIASDTSSEILRTFAIGLGFSCGALAVCLLMNYKDRFIRRFNATLYYICIIILILSCVASYTRTWWITFALTIFINWFFVQPHEYSANALTRFVISTVAVLILFAIIVAAINYAMPELRHSILERVQSISTSINGSQTEDNTFYRRFENIFAGIDVFFSPQILIGYGYGSLYLNVSGWHNGCENSFIYYLWKYGLILGFYLFARVIMKVKRLWRSCSLANRTFVVYFLCEIIIGSLSGNYNYAYGLGTMAFLMGLNYQLIFDDDEGQTGFEEPLCEKTA